MGVLASEQAAESPVDVLYRRYGRDVFALVYHAVGTRADAEDLSQTTFLNAHRALMRGARPTNERAWLLAIARNACCSRFRALARRPREEPFDELQTASSVADESISPVLDALRALPQRQQSALVLHAEGCTVAEVGERLGLGVPAVEALLFRARASLRDELEADAEPLACDHTDALVKLQLAHELPERKQALLRAHLRACSPCAKTARRLRARRRIASLFVLPWELVSRVGGLFGNGAAAVKAASVALALVVGTTAAIADGQGARTGSDVAGTSVRTSPARAGGPAIVATGNARPAGTPTSTAARPGVRRQSNPAAAAPAAAAPTPSAAPQAATPPTTGSGSPSSSTPVTGVAPATKSVTPATTRPSDLPVMGGLEQTVGSVVETTESVVKTVGSVVDTAGAVVEGLPELPPLVPPLEPPPLLDELPVPALPESLPTDSLPAAPPLPPVELPPAPLPLG